MASLPAMAATATASASAKAPAAKTESNMADAMESATYELEQSFGTAKGNPIPILDKLAVYEFSPPTAAKLKTVFGSARPYTLTRAPAAGGMIAFDFSVPAHNYADLNEQTWSWSALNLNMLTDEAGRTLTSSGSWPAFVIDGKPGKMTINNITMEGKQTRNSDDVWVGAARADAKSLEISGKNHPFSIKMEKLSVTSMVEPNGKDYDLGSDLRIELITVMEEKIDDLRASMRMSKLDLKAFEQLSSDIRKKTKPGAEPKLDDFGPQIKAFAKGMSARGTAIELTEMSVGYLGHRALLKGRFSLGKTVEKDFKTTAALLKKMDARFEVRVPVALVTAVTRKMTAAQAATQAETPSPEAIDATVKSMTDMYIKMAVDAGYARLEGDVLVSMLDYKAGQLTVNGKAIALPAGEGKKPVARAKKPARRSK
ncbi:DUF945 domain-containing protein [Massilia sp. CCM 8693]|uniref:DUF945 domain-containing protein n=2 Tax=Massilia aquatica TaxID=2609000 RepID=A0ABX0MCF7_9BURK|nr:DUF945 family protein [Massilia aquatica]NHZ39816.1 DUF945 domain-containing protein [Massilia aquatica]